MAAQWITMRMATLLRVFLQRAASEADQYCFMDAMLRRYGDANIVPAPEIVTIRQAEAKPAGINHVALDRPAVIDILLGFYGLFVVPQPYEVGELLFFLKDVPTPAVFEMYFRRGLPRVMEFGPGEMLDFYTQFMVYINVLTQTCERVGLIAPLAH